MANELAVVNEHWLELVGNAKRLPRPFEREIFLFASDLAVTESEVATHTGAADGLADGETLELVVTGGEEDAHAIEVRTRKGDAVGWISRRWSALVLRLMKAGKAVVCRSRGCTIVEDAWKDLRVDIYMRDI